MRSTVVARLVKHRGVVKWWRRRQGPGRGTGKGIY